MGLPRASQKPSPEAGKVPEATQQQPIDGNGANYTPYADPTGQNIPSAPVAYAPATGYAAPPPYPQQTIEMMPMEMPPGGVVPAEMVAVGVDPNAPTGIAPVPMTAPLEKYESVEDTPEELTNSKRDKSKFRGPLDAKRSCTDIICFIVFLLVAIAFVAIAIVGFVAGDPWVLFRGHNSEGYMCGVGFYTDYGETFSFEPIKCIANESSTYLTTGCENMQCVEKCPAGLIEPWNWPADADKVVTDVAIPTDKGEIALADFCKPDIGGNITVGQAVKENNCPPYIFSSTGGTKLLFRCEPKFLSQNDENMTSLARNLVDRDGIPLGSSVDLAIQNLDEAHNSIPLVSDLTRTLKLTWPHILLFTLITMTVSFIWIFLMRLTGPVLIWFTAVLFVFGSIATCAMSWIIYDGLSKGYKTILWVIPAEALQYVSTDIWLTIGILTTLSSVILLFVFCAVFNRIRLAAAVVVESSRAISGSWGALFWPLVPFLLHIVTLALFFLSMFYFLTVSSNGNGEVRLEATSLQSNLENMWPFILFLVFAWFWITNFILAINYTVLAGSFSSWYWNHGTPHAEKLPLFNSVWRAFRYHMGSMAFGALIIAIVQTIKAVLQFFERRFKAMDNPVGKIMLKCCICCLWCVEKILKGITKNAYIMVALKGKNFCYSARKAFKLIIENVVRIIVLDTISSVLIAISIIVIVGGVFVFALFVFYPSILGWETGGTIPDLHGTGWIPLLFTVVVSIITAICFFSVYKMAIDTIFLNIMYDLKYNDGTPEKPYRAKKSLLKIAGKKNKKEKAP